MTGWLRLAIVLVPLALVTLPVVLWQLLALRTGLVAENRAPKIWHRTIARILGLRIHVVGRMSERRPLLIVANHISWTDVMVLGSFADVSFIAKSELAGWPVMGWLSTLQRTVFVERERRRKSGEQVSEIAARMAGGRAMVLFAEGSTSDGNVLLPFKSTLVGAASAVIAGGTAETVHVQPVAIAYTRLHGVPMGRRGRTVAAWIGGQDLIPHVMGLLANRSVDVEVHFGEAMAFGKGADRKRATRELEAGVRAMFTGALGHPRASGTRRRR